ncbi:hypothetical protein HGRIS_011911 [Hohenbuehelia grisea]
MYWKTLPPEERAEWEAKALAAQAEHRRRYPDWRFRPGANALAKLKVKDGGGGGSRRKRDPGGGGGGGGGGEPSGSVVGKGKGAGSKTRGAKRGGGPPISETTKMLGGSRSAAAGDQAGHDEGGDDYGDAGEERGNEVVESPDARTKRSRSTAKRTATRVEDDTFHDSSSKGDETPSEQPDAPGPSIRRSTRKRVPRISLDFLPPARISRGPSVSASDPPPPVPGSESMTSSSSATVGKGKAKAAAPADEGQDSHNAEQHGDNYEVCADIETNERSDSQPPIDLPLGKGKSRARSVDASRSLLHELDAVVEEETGGMEISNPSGMSHLERIPTRRSKRVAAASLATSSQSTSAVPASPRDHDAPSDTTDATRDSASKSSSIQTPATSSSSSRPLPHVARPASAQTTARRSKVDKDKAQRKSTREDRRLAKITQLLMEGTTGEALERAMADWEGGRKAKRQERASGKHQRAMDQGSRDEHHPKSPSLSQGGEHALSGDGDPAVPLDEDRPGQGTPSTPGATMSVARSRGSVSPSASASGSGSGGTADAEGEDYFSADEDHDDGVVYHPVLGMRGEPQDVSSSSVNNRMIDDLAPLNTFCRSPSFAPPRTPSAANSTPALAHTTPAPDVAAPPSPAAAMYDFAPPSSSSMTFRTTPLTAMFKRSSSAPAPNRRSPYVPRRPDLNAMTTSPSPMIRSPEILVSDADSDLRQSPQSETRPVPIHARSVDSLATASTSSRISPGHVRFESNALTRQPRTFTHSRRDTVSFPVHYPALSRSPDRVGSSGVGILPAQVESPAMTPSSLLSPHHGDTIADHHPTQHSLSSETSPSTYTPTMHHEQYSDSPTDAAEPLDQPPSGVQALAHPMTVRWQEEEHRRRYEASQGSWWPSGTVHEVGMLDGCREEDGLTGQRGAGLGDGARDDAMVWEPYQSLGYPTAGDEPEYEGMYDASTLEPGDISLQWTSASNQARTGLVPTNHDPSAYRHDIHISPFMDVPPSVPGPQEYDPHATGLSSPDLESAGPSPTSASPISPGAISSFSTLTGWAGTLDLTPGSVSSTVITATSSPWAHRSSPWSSGLQSNSLVMHNTYPISDVHGDDQTSDRQVMDVSPQQRHIKDLHGPSLQPTTADVGRGRPTVARRVAQEAPPGSSSGV